MSYIYAVVGSRNFGNQALFGKVLRELITTNDEIVSGGAAGPDTWADVLSQELECNFYRIPAKWNVLGRAAGLRRNPQIVDKADKVVAFWDGKSSGTKSTIQYANKQNKPVLVVYPDGSSKSNEYWGRSA